MRDNKRKNGWRFLKSSLPAVLLLAAAGCQSPTTTSTARSAVEQLLLSTAVDRSLAAVDLHPLAGLRVFLDSTNFDGYDKAYALASLRAKITATGGGLVEKADLAEVIVEPRAGALAIHLSINMIGIPSIKLPIPMAGPVETPEIALFKRSIYIGMAKIAVSGLRKEATVQAPAAAGPKTGTSRFTRWEVLFFPFSSTDIPELK